MTTFLEGVTNLSARLITFFVSSVNWNHALLTNCSNYIAWVYMAVSSGYSISSTFTSKSYAYHDGKAYVEFNGDCRTKLTATCCRCWVNVCRIEDEICRWSLNFIRECLCNSLRLVSAIANCEINCGRCNSFLGLNAMFCSIKFNVNITYRPTAVWWTLGMLQISTLKERSRNTRCMRLTILRDFVFVSDDHLYILSIDSGTAAVRHLC